MRAVVHYAQEGMWDASNTWAITLEEEFTMMLGIRFSSQRADPNNVPKRITQGNCAHYLFVKSKGTLVATIRNTTRRAWREAIFARRPIKDKQEPLPSTTHKEKDNKIPRILHYEHVMRQSYMERASDGEGFFGGIIGYCEGHPKLVKPAAVPTTPEDDTTASSLSTQETPHHLINAGDPRASRQRATGVNGSDASSTADNSGTTLSTTTTGCTTEDTRSQVLMMMNMMQANPGCSVEYMMDSLKNVTDHPPQVAVLEQADGYAYTQVAPAIPATVIVVAAAPIPALAVVPAPIPATVLVVTAPIPAPIPAPGVVTAPIPALVVVAEKETTQKKVSTFSSGIIFMSAFD
jgi:hypothetical protein